MRGADNSFGVATHFYMQIQLALLKIINFNAKLDSVYKSLAKTAQGFEAFQN